MSKGARHPVGFYASCMKSDPDAIFRKKYRPTSKPRELGVFKVERVAKRLRSNHAEFFVKWKNYSRAENTWKPSEHLLADLIADFKSRSVDPHHLKECQERLELLFEGGLKRSLEYCETLTMSHDVIRSLFPKILSDLRGSPYLVGEEELSEAGLASSLKKCLTVTGAGQRFLGWLFSVQGDDDLFWVSLQLHALLSEQQLVCVTCVLALSTFCALL